jgi:hypothetical protein
MLDHIKVSDGWVPIAVRDSSGVWNTLRTAPYTPIEARSYWDLGLLDMAQKRTSPSEFTLYIHARKEKDKRRAPVFFKTTEDEYKSNGHHKRGRK